MKTCLRCGSNLVQNPTHSHWSHCPVCEPGWVDAIRNFLRLATLGAVAATYAADRRGRPSIGGVRQ